jgi:predicted RNA-binding protein YlqC (UPF0109 family)
MASLLKRWGRMIPVKIRQQSRWRKIGFAIGLTMARSQPIRCGACCEKMGSNQHRNEPQHNGLLSVEEKGMVELIAYVVRFLVDYPDEVEVREIEGEQTRVIELKVAKSDMGKVIGKQGRTARALRTILAAASAKLHKRTVLEILE